MKKEKLPVQKAEDGRGPLYHRIYKIKIPAGATDCHRTMERLKVDINRFSPQALAVFRKVKGADKALHDGDEFEVLLNAALPAPVRVKDQKRHSFTLATLQSHIEAGEISFELIEDQNGFIFKIESFARSRDAWIDFFYDKVPLIRYAQTTMWQHMCENFAKDCLREGAELPTVEIVTRKREDSESEWTEL